MESWPSRFFIGRFSGDANFWESKLGKPDFEREHIHYYTVLKIMYLKGYKMWSIEQSSEERVCSQ
jgi:hypothetical protein